MNIAVCVFVFYDFYIYAWPHLKPEQIVHGADNNVDCSCVSGLCPQEVLEI